MNDPTRLLDDPTTPDALRKALAHLASTPPQPYDVAAGLSRLQRAMQVPPSACPGPRISSSTLARAVGVGAGAVVAGGIVAFIAMRPAHVGQPAVAQPAISIPLVLPDRSAAPLVDVNDLPELPPERPSAGAVRPAPRSSVPPAAEDLYREEVLHLANLRRVAGSNPSEALRLAQEGHERFARGMLYQEREAIAIGALSRLGRKGEARGRAERFLARFPRSPYADQIRAEAGIASR